jgi:ABC-type thiamin/hydroxymethylpyrimidine transport system permease subunit
MTPDEHDEAVRLDIYRSGITVVKELGLFALKTLIALNSGAFVVLLTFLGNTAAQSRYAVPLFHLKVGMCLFLAGIAVTFIVIAYTYLAAGKVSPYPVAKKRTDGWHPVVAVILTALAFVCFLLGVLTVIDGVTVTA